VPARITGALFAVLGERPKTALACMLSDAPKHRSINAGWPEAAMAGALSVRLCGPRFYHGELADEPWLNGSARDPDTGHVVLGLRLYVRAMMCLTGLLAVLAFV
jgi:adenosylcobinamide-phosphate synthase